MTCWQQLQSESDFCGVTLVCDDGNIKAHKFMISPCSPVPRIKIFIFILIIKLVVIDLCGLTIANIKNESFLNTFLKPCNYIDILITIKSNISMNNFYMFFHALFPFNFTIAFLAHINFNVINVIINLKISQVKIADAPVYISF